MIRSPWLSECLTQKVAEDDDRRELLVMGALETLWSERPGVPPVVPLALFSHGAPYFANSYVIPATIPRHRLDYAEVRVVTNGHGRLNVYPDDGEPRSHRLAPGSVVLLRPTEQFSYTTSDPEGLSTLYVSFSYAEWQSFTALVGIPPSRVCAADPPTASLDPDDEDALRPFRLALKRYERGPSMLDLVEFWLGVIPILFPAEQAATDPPPAWLTHALDAMRAEPNLRRGVPRLLELAHVSSSHLAANTRRYLGVTPTSLVMELRLRHAARLLMTTTESIGSIAARCGFDKLAYFSTSFRRAYHQSPREYRWRSDRGISPRHD